MTEVVGVELQEMKKSIQESLDNMQAKLEAELEAVAEANVGRRQSSPHLGGTQRGNKN